MTDASDNPVDTQPTAPVKRQPTPHPVARGGWLWAGPPANPVAGPGRPREHIRATLRQHLDETMLTAVLEEWRAGKTTALQVAEFLGRYGLGTQTETVTPEDVAQTAQRMLAVLVDELVSRGWPLPDVQALATKMANAAKGEENT